MKRFNLMPKGASYSAEEGAPVYKTKGNDSELIIMVLPILFAIAVVYFLHTQQQTDIKQNVVSPVQAEKLSTLKHEYETLVAGSQGNVDVGKLIEERNRLKNNLDALRSLNLVKSVPLDLLIAIGKNISDKLALTSIEKKEGSVSLEGIARDNKSLSDFMAVLISQNVFRTVSIKSSEYSDQFGPYKQKFMIVGTL